VLVWDLLGAASVPPFTAVLACELAPGGSVGTHRQEQYPEIVVVTEGEGTAQLDGAPCAIGVGSMIALPLGATLALANGSDEHPLRYLIVKAAGEPPARAT
jgi:quercetin dioxygenase-like cupin family protein